MKKSAHQRHKKRLILLWILIVVLLTAYGYVALYLPLPAIKPTVLATKYQTPSATLTWPTYGESAVGILGTSILTTNGTQTPVPTASTAKLLTALCVLHVKPLEVGEQGPTITLGPNDVAIYNTYVAEDGSVVPVSSGEQISEYQMLEGMMLPSANNMADSLAIWAFGSLSAYSTYANHYAQLLGLTNTHVGTDASGYDPSTTSTASDLVKLGEIALNNPVLAQITSQKTASLPVAGIVHNVNQLLGTDNITGLKTGNSNQALGVFISASTATVAGKPVTVVTALAHAPTLYDAMYGSLPLITTAQANFTDAPIVAAGSAVGLYKLPWGGSVEAVTQEGISSEVWKGDVVTTHSSLQPIPATSSIGTIAGSVSLDKSSFSSTQSVSVVLQKSIPNPPMWWRLIHPKGIFSSDY